MIEHEFYMAADILKILSGGERSPAGVGGARQNRPLFQPSAAEPRLTRWGFQRGGGPDRRITFHQNRTLHLPEILNFYSAPDSCTKGGWGVNSLLLTRRHFVCLHLRSEPGITCSV